MSSSTIQPQRRQAALDQQAMNVQTPNYIFPDALPSNELPSNESPSNESPSNALFSVSAELLRTHAIELDKHDPIGHLIAHFEIPAKTVYLDGNSLGPLPINAKKAAIEVVEKQWGQDLITSWNKHAWIDLPATVGDKIAPLIGAEKGQVICCDSISVNLFKLLASALQLSTPERTIVLSQQDNFPTDLYMVEGLQQMLGTQQCALLTCDADELEMMLQARGHEISVLMLTHVNFRSGQIHNMQKLTQLAHAQGILVIWDLAHSVGAVPVELDNCKVDFALGCGYKYLNGGPGAPAFIYAAKRHIPNLKQPLTGWMGHADPFTFDPHYAPDVGIKKFLSGTPSVIAMAVLSAALDLFEQVTMSQIREKSVAMTHFYQGLIEQSQTLSDLVMASPITSDNRGSQLAYRHPQAYALCQALISHGVIADFRAPDILRFGFSPSFLSFEQLFDSVEKLKAIIESEQYKLPEFNRKQAVT
jgi:kynureninase